MLRKKLPPPKKTKKKKKQITQWIKTTFLSHVSPNDKVSCFASFQKDILQTNSAYKQATGFCLKNSDQKLREEQLILPIKIPVIVKDTFCGY